MITKRVQAILSDYDGTLVRVANMKDTTTNTIPGELEAILNKISAEIPVGIISTKDFVFLRKKTAFARVLSCMMGIETLVLRKDSSSPVIEKRLLHVNPRALQRNSKVLEAIAEEIASHKDFSRLIVERKHTSDGILAGLTVDWRHLNNGWSYYRKSITPFMSSVVASLKKPPVPIVDIYLQEYSIHPFVDVYSTECNKGMAFNTVISELGYTTVNGKGTLYLGDSENDNPAFRKADISIGIRSDIRVNPKLDCSYFLDYEQLSSFLMKLRNSDYLFSDELILEAKKA